MNKTIVGVGIIIAIIGLGCVGASFYSVVKTEIYKETVPTEEEVTKTREVPVETQVPKTRELERQKTVTVKENVPVFKEETSKIIQFIIPQYLDSAPWAFIDFKFESKDPLKFVIKQPATSKKGQTEWKIAFIGGMEHRKWNLQFLSEEMIRSIVLKSFLEYRHAYPEAYLCYFKNLGDTDCAKKEYLDPKEYTIIFEPKKILDEEVLSRFRPFFIGGQESLDINFFFSISEKKATFFDEEWQNKQIKKEELKTIPYLEVYLFDHYELKDVTKTITYKKTETYYETETVMKQETYTEKVTTQKEETKTREVKEKPYAVALWPGVALFLIGIIGVGAGFMKKTTIQPQAPSSRKFCHSCGKENKIESAFCTNCGTPLK